MTRRESHTLHQNPLSAARGKRNVVEALWHRKTGAGYRLFVKYYSGQPTGVAWWAVEQEESKNKDGAAAGGSGASSVLDEDSPLLSKSTARGTNHVCGKGMSRASKRRRKQQAQKGAAAASIILLPEEDSKNLESNGAANCPPRTWTDEFSSTIEIPPLLRALEKEDRLDRTSVPIHGLPGFLIALSKPLPITFRIRESASLDLVRTVQQGLESFQHAVLPLAAGNGTMFQSCNQLSKSSLRFNSPDLKRFLNAHSSDGTIARQELGSMLPVLLLQKSGAICAGSRVLDLCASPGSKALQASELVGPSGRVRANDIHPTRLDSLREAVTRSGIPHIEKIVKYSNLDAGQYPIPTEHKAYDAVLCDVPCSGDGTCRKDAHLLPNWSPGIGNVLHVTQVRILQRALECVRIGGVVCYSTCSLNPVEDEAVVAAALSNASRTASSSKTAPPPSFELMTLPPLHGLILRPGVRSWKVAECLARTREVDSTGDSDDDEDTPELQWIASPADAVAVAGGIDRGAVPTTLWPNRDTSSWPLERCGRLLPQDHDSGGFFVALLRRTA